MTFGLLLGHSVESIFKFMNPNIFQPLPVLSTDEIREILVKRVDQQKQAVGIVVGVVEPDGRRVVAYGNLANGDPRTLDGDTIFEIGSISKVFTSLLLADMVNRKEVALDDPAAKISSGKCQDAGAKRQIHHAARSFDPQLRASTPSQQPEARGRLQYGRFVSVPFRLHAAARPRFRIRIFKLGRGSARPPPRVPRRNGL